MVQEQLIRRLIKVLQTFYKEVHLCGRGGDDPPAIPSVDPDNEVVTDPFLEVERDTPGQVEAPVLHGVEQLALLGWVQGIPKRLVQVIGLPS